MGKQSRYQTTHYQHITPPSKAVTMVKRQAALFQDITEYRAGDGIACVFQYKAKDGSWCWGWAPHGAQFLLSPWLRELYRATDQQDAMDRALSSIDWQCREAAARYQLLSGI